jgi:hypothetical protein
VREEPTADVAGARARAQDRMGQVRDEMSAILGL